MPSPAAVPPRALRRPRPSREAILEAREARRHDERFFVASIVWAVLAGSILVAAVLAARGHTLRDLPLLLVRERVLLDLPPLLLVGGLLPGALIGVLAGPRVRPGYVLVLIIGTIFSLAVPLLWAVPLSAGAVLLLGYGFDALRSIVTHGRLYDPPRPAADEPRGAGDVGSNKLNPLQVPEVTVASAAPTGSELPKRRIL